MNRYLCLALLMLAAASAVASEITLDLRPTAVWTRGVAAPRATQTEEEAGTLRQTVLDAGAASTGSLAVGDVLRLSVYDDVTLSLTLVAREEAPLARASFQAEVSGANWRDAVVTETDAGLLVTATDPASGLVYAVVSSDDRVTVREIDPHALPVVDGGVCVPELDAVQEGVPTTRSAASTDQASTVVDMLVAYDRSAAAWAKANGGGVTNLAQQCVARMNGALANNGLDATFRFRLVGVLAVDADGDGNLNDTLDKVTQKTGAWAAVSAMRDAVGADVVSTMVDTGSAYGTTGLGWALEQTTASGMSNFSEYAYNVLSVRAAAQSHVMTHETGHNMGAGHADAQTSSPGPQSFDYSSGFYFTGTDKRAYHTIMAYNTDGYGNSYNAAPLFSDPDNTWAGVPAGDATHDNAQVLARTYVAVTQFRAQKVALSYDVFFSPEGGTLFSDSVTVTLTPGKAGLAIRYTTDGSDPTATHGSLYTSPLTLTKTTTIRAATVTDGTTGPVYTATYYKSDLGAALNAPQLVWDTSAGYPWTAQATNTYDGTLAVQSAALPKGTVNRTWLSTTVTGPTKMSFRYRAMMYSSSFRVYLDSSVAWQTADAVDDWTLVEVDVPTGAHAVKFEYEQRGYYSDPTFCGIWLDDVRFDALSRPPQIQPATTADESTATTFTGTLSVTLTPSIPSGQVFYTLDGSDPAGETGIAYERPIVLTQSTRLRAVEIDPGKDASAEVGGLFLERHPLKAGEWTTDVAGAKAAAAQDGALICVLLANHRSCGWCQAFHPVAQSQTFLGWARANGVYLVEADSSLHVDAAAATDYFWTLFQSYGDSGSVGYPTLYFALANAPDEAIAKGVARHDGSAIGGVAYEDTVESLVAGFSAILSQHGFTPTPLTYPSPADVLGTTGVEWTNASDVPWREEAFAQMRIGGLQNTTYASELTARVSGRGTFIFTYRAVSYSWQNTFSFFVDGAQKFQRAYDGNTTSAETVTNVVTSTSGATFTWKYEVKDASRDYSSCGAWISDVRWIPEGSEGVTRMDGNGNEILIPASWFEHHGLAPAGATAADLATAADADSDGDDMSNWTEYVCGTDPNNADDRLRCTISFVDGSPVVGYEPRDGYLSGYRAVLKGKASLSDATWTDATPQHRFFKVFVEMK